MSESEQVFAGKYRLIAELGRGGMAEVSLAVASGPAGFNKLVVTKQLRQNLAEDPEFLSMFLDEARLAARLNHPNVVHTYEVVADGSQHFIAMEYLDGQPLNRIIRDFAKSGGLPLGIYLRILCDALAGIHYAHELADYDGTPLNVVHRDISPHNIFVTYEGMTKVVDFGIAKALNTSSETRTGVIKGKISYMSPEQSRSESLDRRSDLFAVGIMLWEAITGQRLWKGLSDVTILQRLMMNQPVPHPSEVKPGVSEPLAAICMKALEPLAENRYASAIDMQNAIEDVLLDMRVRVNPREVGKLLMDKFAAERAEIRTVIESQLRLQPGEVSRMGKLNLSLSQSQSLPAQNADTPARTTLTPPPSTTSEPDSRSSLSLTPPVPAPPPAPAASSSRLVVLGAAALGLVLVGGWAALSGRKPAADNRPADSQQITKVALNIQASPADARLFLDGEPLSGNPFAGFRPRDGSPHTLRIEADGRTPKTHAVVFDADISLNISLEKAPDSEPAKTAEKVDDKAESPKKKSDRQPGASPSPGAKAADTPKADPKADAPKTVEPPKKNANVKLDTENPWR